MKYIDNTSLISVLKLLFKCLGELQSWNIRYGGFLAFKYIKSSFIFLGFASVFVLLYQQSEAILNSKCLVLVRYFYRRMKNWVLGKFRSQVKEKPISQRFNSIDCLGLQGLAVCNGSISKIRTAGLQNHFCHIIQLKRIELDPSEPCFPLLNLAKPSLTEPFQTPEP